MNNINKIFLGLAITLSASFCSSCSDDSEKLIPGEPMQNFFAPDPSDKSATAELRRSFQSETGIYLLFSDILGTYIDDFGMERTDKLDFRWGFNQYSTFSYNFVELEEGSRNNVANLVKRYYVPYVNVEGGSLKPYSILLVSNLNSNQSDTYEDPSPVDYMENWQCLALNADNWMDIDDEDARVLGREILRQLVSTKLSTSTPELELFFEISAQYYDDYYVADSYPEWMDDQNIELIYESGFLSYDPDSWGDVDYDCFLSEKNDLKDFISALFKNEESAFKEKWGNYPRIIQKYDLLKECIEGLGINLNAVK